VVVVVDVVVGMVVVEVMGAAPISDDVGVPLQDSMFLHHCTVFDSTLSLICHHIPKPHDISTIPRNSDFEIVSLYFHHTVY
jgi:hypothetical protein